MYVLPLSRPVASSWRRVVAPVAFDASLERFLGGSAQGARTPAVDVAESDTAFTLTFDVPGVARERLQVSVEGRRVRVETVDAAPPAPDAADAAAPGAGPAPTPTAAAPASRTLYRERGAARYARTVLLPADVDQDASTARVEHGVLTLTLAKKVRAGATRISVG